MHISTKMADGAEMKIFYTAVKSLFLIHTEKEE